MGNLSSDWMKIGICLAEGHVCGTGDCLKTLAEQHCQLARLFGGLSMSGRREMEFAADCHGFTEVNLENALALYSMTSPIARGHMS